MRRLVIAGALILTAAAHFTSVPAYAAAVSSDCPVTQPNGVRLDGEPASGNHGNRDLVTWLWPHGAIVFKPGGPGYVLPDGSLSMKFGWWRLRAGKLRIEGRRIDGGSYPLRAEIPGGYGDSGFQATALIFPRPGCWEVTARVGDSRLRFITLVEKIGDGPLPAHRPPVGS
jgi:hypothetical protein